MRFLPRSIYAGFPLCLACFFTLAFFSALHAQSSLDTKINLPSAKTSLEDLLANIESQTDLSFVYSSSLIVTDKSLEIRPNQNTSLSDIFSQIENQTGLAVIPSGKQITIRPKGTGQILGRILGPDQRPLDLASITVKGTSIGTTSGDDGRFSLAKVPEGLREIEVSRVGYLSQRIQVNVQQDATLDLKNLTLREDVRLLDQIDVSALPERDLNEFANKETDYVARMPLENLENPQVYNVISGKLIKQQVTVAVQDAIRNAPGAVPVINPSGGLSIYFRGFGVGVNSRNGMETTSERSSLDIANVERIEILKGPSATLFGPSVSSFGGLVNLVTKKPLDQTKTEISYTTGSFGLNRLAADINTPLKADKSVILRVNAAINRQQSFLDYGFNNTFLLAPSLDFKASDRLDFLIDLEYLQVNNTQPMNFIINSPDILNPEDIKLDFRSTLFHENADVKNYSTRLFAQANYRLSANFKSTTLFSYVSENVDHSFQRPVIWTSPTTAIRAAAIYGPVYNGYTNIQENINGEFQTGRITHKILAGANLRLFSGKFLFSESRIIDNVDLNEGFMPLTRQEIEEGASFIDNPTPDQTTASVYATDVLEFGEKLSLMLALRLDHFDREALEEIGDEGFSQTSLAPKLGAVYQVVPKKISVFANYMSGFQNMAPVIQPDGSRLTVDPVFANQAEGGIKIEIWEDKMSFTASYYNILIDNAVRIDEDQFTVQDGKQESKGIDLELIAEPIPGLNLLAGYAYNDNRIIKASDEAIEGNKAANAPESVANFWISYSFQQQLKGLGLGLGMNYIDQLYRSTSNTFFVPSYTLLNASVQYELDNWGIQLKINNLTDARYWDHYGNPQTPANFAANLSLRF